MRRNPSGWFTPVWRTRRQREVPRRDGEEADATRSDETGKTRQGEREPKLGTLHIAPVAGPHAPALDRHQPLDHRKAEADAFRLPARHGRTVEGIEELVDVHIGESGAFVQHTDDRLLVHAFHLHHELCVGVGVLLGVAKVVFEDLVDPGLLPLNDDVLGADLQTSS